MKTLKQILYEDIMQGIDPAAQSSANIVLLMNRLKTSPEFSQLLSQLVNPSDKYKAISKFADLLGIPSERFVDFIQQQKNQEIHNQTKNNDTSR